MSKAVAGAFMLLAYTILRTPRPRGKLAKRHLVAVYMEALYEAWALYDSYTFLAHKINQGHKNR
ncbi:hypothetical protein BY996DRAFT_6604191 [Phakopsora pachyrhizi]|nr:hypothetical protein BY996DRAFT_6604191 [Phakopsora pachyrhizi]